MAAAAAVGDSEKEAGVAAMAVSIERLHKSSNDQLQFWSKWHRAAQNASNSMPLAPKKLLAPGFITIIRAYNASIQAT